MQARQCERKWSVLENDALTGSPWPDEGGSLRDERPARAEAEEPDALVARPGPEEVADELMTAIVCKTDDRDGGKKREGVLGDPEGMSIRIQMRTSD